MYKFILYFLGIEYNIKKVTLDDGKHLYCLWVARDPVEVESVSDIPPPSLSNSTSHSGTNKTDKSQTEVSLYVFNVLLKNVYMYNFILIYLNFF